jgi:hypothetical protein
MLTTTIAENVKSGYNEISDDTFPKCAHRRQFLGSYEVNYIKKL